MIRTIGWALLGFTTLACVAERRRVDSDNLSDGAGVAADAGWIDWAVRSDPHDQGPRDAPPPIRPRDAGPPPLPDVEWDPPPDADVPDRPDMRPPPARESCVIDLHVAETRDAPAQNHRCAVSMRSMVGCDDFIGCLCELGQGDEARCAEMSLVPRGQVTLADYCWMSGEAGHFSTLGDAVWQYMDAVGGYMEPAFGPAVIDAIDFNDACFEVAAFSTWGVPSEFGLSFTLDDDPIRELRPDTELADVPVERPPLLEMDHLEGFDFSSFQLLLNHRGRTRVLSSPMVDRRVIRPFLIYTGVPILVGTWTSERRSATQPGGTIFTEELERTDWWTIRVRGEAPSDQPPELNAWRAQLLRVAFAAAGKRMDANCLSTCGCPLGRVCDDGVCVSRHEGGCRVDADCCGGRCGDDGMCDWP